jgi:hypothetical protein
VYPYILSPQTLPPEDLPRTVATPFVIVVINPLNCVPSITHPPPGDGGGTEVGDADLP